MIHTLVCKGKKKTRNNSADNTRRNRTIFSHQHDYEPGICTPLCESRNYDKACRHVIVRRNPKILYHPVLQEITGSQYMCK
jgi:hypothetical protein